MKTDGTFRFVKNKVILHLRHRVCESPEELLASDLFAELVRRFVEDLRRRNAPILLLFARSAETMGDEDLDALLQTLRWLGKVPITAVSKLFPGSEPFVREAAELHGFVERLYDFWRSFERFLVCDSTGDSLDQRPYRTFNATIEALTHLVRQVYRDIQENISGRHPTIYRQVHAGAEVAVIALPKELPLPPGPYGKLRPIRLVRQILLYPPLALNPPMNKRTGQFERIGTNPLELVDPIPDEWLCYPARVGELLILVYIHEQFLELGLTLANLFELADDEALQRPADAVFLFGVPGDGLRDLAPLPTVFFDDHASGMLAAACPHEDRFGYFGYLKKMILTLHNIRMMKLGRLPFHGAMVRVVLQGDRAFTILLIGDTGAGKSETLEAFRTMAGDRIEELTVVADDMGSLALDPDGTVRGYGTETGAFVRLDDLPQGYAFGQLDRAIFLNTGQQNARVVLPVTSYDAVVRGYPVDVVLYANNHEEVSPQHPLVEPFSTPEAALAVFREGTSMSKGTTTATGLGHTYFVNPFGAVQYREIHDSLAERFFEAFFRGGIFVGQCRTRLGLPGWERRGPEAAAGALLSLLSGTDPDVE